MSKSPLAGQALGATTINELDETVAGAPKSSFAIEYSPSFPVLVYVNTAMLSTDDYTQTSGTEVVLDVALEVGEHIHIIAYKVVGLYGSDTTAESDAKLALKLDKSGGTYTGVKETQDLTHTVDGAGQTVTLDYSNGNTQALDITTGDDFTIAFSNWPTTEAGSMTLLVTVALGVTVGTITWPTTKNDAPDFTGITADTGEGVYTIFFGNSAYRVYVVEET